MLYSRITVFAFLLSLITFNPLWADDTEIFFGGASGSTNILFVFDASGSMDRVDPGHATSRLERMREALKEVFTRFTGINIGLMQFNLGENGGRIIYPVTDIDAVLCGSAPCDSDNTLEAFSSVAESTDDAIEDNAGNVTLDENVIPMMEFGGDSFFMSAMRFPNLRIPQGATIIDARLEFAPATDSDEPTDLTFSIENSGDAQPYNTGVNSIKDRPKAASTVAWNTVTPWNLDSSELSPDISPLIQHVVNRPDWCGGNAVGINVQGTGSRLAKSFDLSANEAPALRIQYTLDNLPSTGGCTLSTTSVSLKDRFHDVEESVVAGPGTSRTDILLDRAGRIFPLETSLRVNYRFMTGFQFDQVSLPPNAVIKEARLILRNSGQGVPGQSMRISLEDSGQPSPLRRRNFNLTRRSFTSDVLWENAPLNDGELVRSANIASLVESIAKKNTWRSGNSIHAFIRSTTTNTAPINSFYSYEADPVFPPQLQITFQSKIQNDPNHVNGTAIPVRESLFNRLDDLRSSGGTPTIGAMLEAQSYFAGGPVNYGRKRSVFRFDDASKSRVSHPDSYKDGNVVRSPACFNSALNSDECADEMITGAPVYISPINSECQSNHIVLVTDGKPSPDLMAKAAAEELTGKTCVTPVDSNGRAQRGGHCGVELAEYFATTDLNSDIADVQSITTHTIGFNFNNKWLKDLANASGGIHSTANSASELVASISDIFKSVHEGNSTFVSPGATVDRFTQLSHRKDVYLALFKPTLNPRWGGNIKKFNIDGSPPQLHDANSNIAVDENTGQLKNTSRSFWTTTGITDGNNIFLGGAASKLDPNNRVLVSTLQPGNDTLVSLGNRINNNNNLLTNAQLNVDTNQEREDLIDWLYGFDIKDENENNSVTDYRHHIGDPLHSRPVIVTYGGTSEEPDSLVFIGTNEGFIHAINANDGTEQYAFMPAELIDNLRILYDNNEGVNKPYGMDGELSVQIKDENNNGILETGDAAYLYAGMRRGGRQYYSLDVTDKNNPLLRWQITGGIGDFSELGQTWSKPQLSQVRVGDEFKDVLVFGGGYDDTQDDNSTRTKDSVGRAIYIVNAETGKLIWSGGPQEASPTSVFPSMQYSIPSDLRLINGDDGLLSQIYVGDMGGRVWRFDVRNGSNKANLVEGGIIADLAQDLEPAHARRFFHAPDLSLTKRDDNLVLNIAIGSGFQAHPLDQTIEDRFYVIRYPFSYSGFYGISNDLNIYQPINENDLFDTTDNIISEGDETERADAIAELASKEGWLIKMDDSGEKILGSSTTFNNIVKFASYSPQRTSTSTDVCVPDISIGSSFFYSLNLSNGTPSDAEITEDENQDTSTTTTQKTKEDRRVPIPSGGIAPPINTLFVETNGETSVVDFSGANVVDRNDGLSLVERWFWAETPE